MGFQPVPNTVSVEFVYWNGSTYAENVLHFKFQEAITLPGLQSLATQLRAWWADQMQSLFPATFFLAKIVIKDLSEQNGLAIEYTAGMPLPGTSAAYELAPMNVAVSVKKLTGQRGRSYRGRIFQPGISKTVLTGDRVSQTFATNLKQAYESLLVEDWSVDAYPCVVSRWSNLLPRAAGVTTQITGFDVDTVVDSQRRRLLGRGM